MHGYPYKILDPIHGFIRFNEIEEKVIDTLLFQRLRYIHQMGVSYLVYPGAHHSRFEHSLGVMELAGRIFDALLAKPNPLVNLDLDEQERSYWRTIVRLAALCHDMGHLPFSHIAEKNLLGPKGHEKMTYQMLQSQEMHFIGELLGEKAIEDVIKVAIDQELLDTLAPHLHKSRIERLFSKIITEDNFGADRIDYLIRDAYYTGVGYGHFDYHQLIDTLRILPLEGELTLGITSSGMQSVESLWIARYLMYARVYKHPKSCLYSAHMERYMSGLPLSLELKDYLFQTDYTVLEGMARSDNEDARILLKKEPPYKICTLTEDKQRLVKKNLVSLQERFGSQIMVEMSDLQKGSRDFWICEEDSTLHTSDSYSEFLNKIPLGIKSIQLFVHPSIYKNINIYLQDF